MYLKSREKYLIIGTIACLIIFYCFCPLFETITPNGTFFYTCVGLKFEDGGVFTALFVGVETIVISAYNSDKNYKSMKLSLIPQKSADLLIDLEFIFNEKNIYSKEIMEDSIIPLIEILKYWHEHQKVFRVLTPNFYKNLMKMWDGLKFTEENEKTFEKNSKIIFNMIIKQFSEVSTDKNKKCFEYINPNYISDDEIIDEETYEKLEYEMNRLELCKFINNIKGIKTKKLTKMYVDEFYENLKNTLSDLNREIDEYG